MSSKLENSKHKMNEIIRLLLVKINHNRNLLIQELVIFFFHEGPDSKYPGFVYQEATKDVVYVLIVNFKCNHLEI